MVNGEYIKDRWIVAMLQSIAKDKSIGFSSWSDDWLIELKRDDKVHRIIGYKFDINNSVASSISQDKVASFTILNAQNIPAVRHELVRTKASDTNKEVMEGWSRIVMKPLEGTSGHGVRLFDNVDAAIQMIESSGIQAWAVAPFIDIEHETRIIMLDKKVLLAYEKQPVSINGLKMFNLGLGASATVMNPSRELVELAFQSQATLGLRLAAVDIIQDNQDNLNVLEVNDGIMMEHFARMSESNKILAKKVYHDIIEGMFVSPKK